MGAGFWARFQLAAWGELPGVAWSRSATALDQARALAAEFGVPAVYDDAGRAARGASGSISSTSSPTSDTQPRFVQLAAAAGLPVICQKPMAPSLAEAERMVAACREAGVPLLRSTRTWRWQTPIRELQGGCSTGGAIGAPFRARIDMISGFRRLRQPALLREVERVHPADVGSHLLDVARFLFGEAERLYCQTGRVHPGIKGEDVATVMMTMGGGRPAVRAVLRREPPRATSASPRR